MLVHWSGVPKEEASWEDYDDMVKRFPDFSLEDKGILKEMGNYESTKRRSKRVKGASRSLKTHNTSNEQCRRTVRVNSNFL